MKPLLVRYAYSELNVKFTVNKKYAMLCEDNFSELQPIWLSDFCKRFSNIYMLKLITPATSTTLKLYENINKKL